MQSDNKIKHRHARTFFLLFFIDSNEIERNANNEGIEALHLKKKTLVYFISQKCVPLYLIINN